MKRLIVSSAFLLIVAALAAQTTPPKKTSANNSAVSAKKAIVADTSAKKKQPTGFNVKAIQQEQHTPANSQNAAGQNSFLPKPGNEKNTSEGNKLKKLAAPKKN